MSTAQTPSDLHPLVSRYIEMWNESDPLARRRLVEETLTENATYTDPMAHSDGIEAITALIGNVQEQFAGLQFTLHDGPDAHHDYVRFSWALGPDSATPVAVGTDIAQLADDGRMSSIVGFLETIA